MAKQIKFGISLNKELLDKLDRRCEELTTKRSTYIGKLIEADFATESAPSEKSAPIDIKEVAKMEPSKKAMVMGKMTQAQLDELYKVKQTLGNGVVMPGTYVDIYNYGKGDLLSK